MIYFETYIKLAMVYFSFCLLKGDENIIPPKMSDFQTNQEADTDSTENSEKNEDGNFIDSSSELMVEVLQHNGSPSRETVVSMTTGPDDEHQNHPTTIGHLHIGEHASEIVTQELYDEDETQVLEIRDDRIISGISQSDREKMFGDVVTIMESEVTQDATHTVSVHDDEHSSGHSLVNTPAGDQYSHVLSIGEDTTPVEIEQTEIYESDTQGPSWSSPGGTRYCDC